MGSWYTREGRASCVWPVPEAVLLPVALCCVECAQRPPAMGHCTPQRPARRPGDSRIVLRSGRSARPHPTPRILPQPTAAHGTYPLSFLTGCLCAHPQHARQPPHARGHVLQVLLGHCPAALHREPVHACQQQVKIRPRGQDPSKSGHEQGADGAHQRHKPRNKEGRAVQIRYGLLLPSRIRGVWALTRQEEVPPVEVPDVDLALHLR